MVIKGVMYMDSILTSIKKLLGIEEEYTHFDTDIIIYINSALMYLNQLGVGPETGFYITSDSETWDNYLNGETTIESVKSFVYLRTRLIFDPPSSSSVIDAIERQIKEAEWRILVQAERGAPVE